MTRFAPYIFAWGRGSNEYKTSTLSDINKLKLKNITLAFLVSDRYEEIQSWKQDILNYPNIEIILSLGGASGKFVNFNKSIDRQVSELVNLLKDLKISKIDLDIEGTVLENPIEVNRWIEIIFETLKILKLEITLTLPVEWYGLNEHAINVINKSEKLKINIKFINLMIMDFYTKLDRPNWAIKHIQILKIVKNQLNCNWDKIGYCPMIGENDDGSKFTIIDWETVLDFITEKNIGLVTFWAINRDQGKHGFKTHSVNTHSRCQFKDLEYTQIAINKLYTCFSKNNG
jgi:chitinase